MEKIKTILDVVDGEGIDIESVGNIMSASDEKFSRDILNYKIKNIIGNKLVEVYDKDVLKRCRDAILVNLSEERIHGCDIFAEYGIINEQEIGNDSIKTMMFMGAFDKDYNFIKLIPADSEDTSCYQENGNMVIAIDFARVINKNTDNKDLVDVFTNIMSGERKRDTFNSSVTTKIMIIEPIEKGVGDVIGTIYHIFETHTDGKCVSVSKYKLNSDTTGDIKRVLHSEILFNNSGPFGGLF
ncbi:MAG: hypothetical protein ACRC92_04145 [Peptostreptococcaceae bacterium]